ncbi:MAG: glycosyltransferase family 39 protein [Candidatus Eisenbacteria bacterium]|nr:glycosyltransferase family 39 protein [Candidatus Eisenbacteria bacterium]
MKTRRSFKVIVFVTIWLFATAINLNKAYHIDDAAYLEMAEWILQNPLHPMSGLVNWEQNAEPISVLNQPHLYPYLLAGWSKFLGFGEVWMHTLQSFFTLACIILIYLICNVVIPSRALFLTALLTLSPAFVVGQNLMVDIPLLSFWLAFYYVLIRPGTKSETRRFALAGFLAGCACLIKYSSLCLIATMLIYMIVRKQFRLVWTMGIPVGILVLWSCFNYWDYGSIHILDRPSRLFGGKGFTDMGLAWLACLGAILTFSPIYLRNLWHTMKLLNAGVRTALILALISLAVMIVGVYLGAANEYIIRRLLCMLFLVNGIGIVLLACGSFLRNLKTIFTETREITLLLYLWLVSGALFTVFLAPFIATRHVLLVIVPLCLVLARFLEVRPSFSWNAGMLLLTILITSALGLSDRIWADFYKEKAALIRSELPGGANIYFSGHWGWQWYAGQNGMKQLEALNPQLEQGDYLAYPEGIHQQSLTKISQNLQLKVVKKYTEPASPFTVFSTRDGGGFYISTFSNPPWALSRKPIAPIVLYRAEAAVEEQD